MAARVQAQTGSLSSTSTWVGGVVPSTGDTVDISGFTLTLDADLTCVSVSDSLGSGRIILSNSTPRTLTANVIAVARSITMFLVGTGRSLTIVGNVTIGSAGAISTVGLATLSSNSAMTLTGSVTAYGCIVFVGGTNSTVTVAGNAAVYNGATLFFLSTGASLTYTGTAIADPSSTLINQVSANPITLGIATTLSGGSGSAVQSFGSSLIRAA